MPATAPFLFYSAALTATGSTSRGREWRRYGPAEVLALAATLGAAAVAARASRPGVARARAATWAGNLAYCGCLLRQDAWQTRRAVRPQLRSSCWRRAQG